FGGMSGHSRDRNFGGGFNGLGGGGARPSNGFGGGGNRPDFGGGGGGFGGGNRPNGGDGFGGNRPNGGNGFGGGNRPNGGDGFGGNRPNGGDGFGGGNRPNGGDGFGGNRPNGGFNGNRPNNRLPTDGGMSGIAGNRTPKNIDRNTLNNQGNSIRNSFNNNNFNNVNVNRYGRGGYGAGFAHGYGAAGGYHGGYHGWGYPGAWGCGGWGAATAWTMMGVSTLTSFLGMGMMAASGGHSSSEPVVNNVTYEGDNVYVNGQPSGSQQQYYQQAQQLASQASSSGNYDQSNDQNNYSTPDSQTASTEEWQPLGVFSLAEPGATQSNTQLQLAINKAGTIRGNYLNMLTNEKAQIYGSLDKKTQRISWTLGQDNSTVFDTSFGDLVKDDSTVLVHYGPDNTREMALIRLPAPKDGDAPTGNNTPTG
ncbi:MAG: hypothetical protein SGJ27_06065, partial [Candidatus Melainabacteria bacterium]|nr:hypothetical protein [Candidatus Melainabacteria bacterium]